jgi:AcrR family transcriptional regulator
MPRAGLSPERVVTEAALVADEVGLDHVTLAAVALRFGVAAPSLYKHIDGLEGLRCDLAVLGMQQLGTVLHHAAIGRSGKDALTSTAIAYRTFAKARPGLYQATMRAPHPDDELHTAVSQDVLDVAIAVMRGYGIEGVDAVHAIRMFRSALHGFIAQEASGAFGMPESIEESYRLMIEALNIALSNWATLA